MFFKASRQTLQLVQGSFRFRKEMTLLLSRLFLVSEFLRMLGELLWDGRSVNLKERSFANKENVIAEGAGTIFG